MHPVHPKESRRVQMERSRALHSEAPFAAERLTANKAARGGSMSGPSVAVDRAVFAAAIFAGLMVLSSAVALISVRPWRSDRVVWRAGEKSAAGKPAARIVSQPSHAPPPLPHVSVTELAASATPPTVTARPAPSPADHRSAPAPVRALPLPAVTAVQPPVTVAPPPPAPVTQYEASAPAPPVTTPAPAAETTVKPSPANAAASAVSLHPVLAVPEEDLSGASPVDRQEIEANLAAVRGLQAGLGKPVKEFHVHQGYQTQLFPDLSCMLTHLDQKHGRFTLVLLRNEGAKQTVKGDVATPLPFLGNDGVAHQLVIRSLAAGQAYGYLIP